MAGLWRGLRPYSEPKPPSSQSPSYRWAHVFEQRPQSAQSVPGEQSEYSDPGPPSSQSPSREWTQKFVHIVASIGAAVAAAFAAGSAATTATFSAGGAAAWRRAFSCAIASGWPSKKKVPLPPDHPKRIANTPKSPEEEMKAKMPVFLDAMLRVSLVDVYETLRKVVHRVLADESVDMDARRRRAAALKLFADALHAASSEVAADVSSDVEPEKRFEHAMNVTMAAAMGQEMSEGHGDSMPPTV